VPQQFTCYRHASRDAWKLPQHANTFAYQSTQTYFILWRYWILNGLPNVFVKSNQIKVNLLLDSVPDLLKLHSFVLLGGDQLNNLHWTLVLFCLVVLYWFCQISLCVILFFWFWVQGGHSFETIYWSIVRGLVTFTWTLASCSSCLSRYLWREVLCNYPAVKGTVKEVHAGMQFSTPSTKVYTTKKTKFYIGASCGVNLAYQLERSKVLGYLLCLCLEEGF